MKKIVLMVMLMISSMFGNELVLSGEYAKDLGNPFRVVETHALGHTNA